MNSSLTSENVLLSLAAVSFAATAVFLFLSVLTRISFRVKTRLLRVFFSLGLTAVLAGLLARAADSTVAHAPGAATSSGCHRSPGFTLSR